MKTIDLQTFARNFIVVALLANAVRAAPQETDGRGGGKTSEIKIALASAADRVDEIQTKILEAMAQAEAAKTAADLEALNASIDALDMLASDLASATRAIRIASSPVTVEIEDALNKADPSDAERAMKKIESALQAKVRTGDVGANNLLTVARFRLADFWRREAQMDLRSQSPSTGSLTVLSNAANKFREVLECPDARVADIGPSIHAAALRRIVECEVDLYLAYASTSPLRPSALSTHETAATEAYKRLQRAFPEQDTVDGRGATAEARQQMERLRRAKR